jgi:hypothetical protein
MGFPEYKRHVRTRSAEWVLDEYYHTGEPFAFHDRPPELLTKLLRQLARKLSAKYKVPVHTRELIICGSGHLGFCPIPQTARWGKAFDPNRSDIDVAVVSIQLFNKCWVELQDRAPQDVSDIAAELYWGFFNPATIRAVYAREHMHHKFADTWWSVFGSMTTDAARGVRGRLYRSLWEMQNYHKRGITLARQRLLAGRLT